jgi:beta-lactamase superfamily II metal-dependent hydrolase
MPLSDISMANSGVYISSAVFNAPGDDTQNLNGEIVTIKNGGNYPVIMTGWKLSDLGNRNVYIFPAITVSPDESVNIHTGKGVDTDNELFMGKTIPVWNNDGDIATITDNNGIVVSRHNGRSNIIPLPSSTLLPPINDTVPPAGNMTVYFMDAEQGDSILLTYNGSNVLIDAGEIEQGPLVASRLKSLGIKDIDLLVATHPHSDHIGGLLTILDELNVRHVLDSGQIHTTETYMSFLTKIDQKNIPYTEAQRGQRINIGSGMLIEVLSPPVERFATGLNDNSVVLKVTFGNVKFLFTGDAEFESENNMISQGIDIDSDILKVAHHGSKYSTGSLFLSKVTPESSILMVGENDYGHPSKETLDRLKMSGTDIYRTDLIGEIIVKTDGKTYIITDISENIAIPYAGEPGSAPSVTITSRPSTIPFELAIMALLLVVYIKIKNTEK